jgi:hypothetical protein
MRINKMQFRYKFLLLLVAVISCSVWVCNAQKGKAEITLQYGYYSNFTVYNGAPFSASSGTMSVNGKYYISDIVSVGLGLGFENNSSIGSYLSVIPEFTFRYLDTRDNRVRVRLYGAAAWGLTVYNDVTAGPNNPDQTGPKLYGFQVTPVGVRVGRKYAAFLELGYGYKGIINGGIGYRFRAHTIHEPLENR